MSDSGDVPNGVGDPEEKEDHVDITDSPAEMSTSESDSRTEEGDAQSQSRDDDEADSDEESGVSDNASDEDGDEDDDEDEDEPALKYERITGGIPDLLKKDSASALTITNNKTLVSIVKDLLSS